MLDRAEAASGSAYRSGRRSSAWTTARFAPPTSGRVEQRQRDGGGPHAVVVGRGRHGADAGVAEPARRLRRAGRLELRCDGERHACCDPTLSAALHMFGPEEVLSFLEGALPRRGIRIRERLHNGRVLEIELPEEIRGRYSELGGRTVVRVTVDRRLAARDQRNVSMDFASVFFSDLSASYSVATIREGARRTPTASQKPSISTLSSSAAQAGGRPAYAFRPAASTESANGLAKMKRAVPAGSHASISRRRSAAAVDERVVGIVPIVFDVLNMEASIRLPRGFRHPSAAGRPGSLN